jgi:hypothetical protein
MEQWPSKLKFVTDKNTWKKIVSGFLTTWNIKFGRPFKHFNDPFDLKYFSHFELCHEILR